MNTFENIAAPATGVNGAVSIIRISGPDALAIGNSVWHGRSVLSVGNVRKMLLGYVGLDRALAVYMKKPASYTGDDVVELHCHGGAAAAEHVLHTVLAHGCRMAEPGEFTFRAFVNGKLDLLQAEAVADIIGAGSEHALRMAEKQLSGFLSKKLSAIYDQLTSLLAECESNLDFSEEAIQWELPAADAFDAVAAAIDDLLKNGESGAVFRDGVNVVIAGRPNAGKSSLLNYLLGFERAIVTAIPGTTRDTVEAEAILRKIPVRLTDTAGLRKSSDTVEQLGVERSGRSIRAAQVIFWVLDASSDDLFGEIAAMAEYPVENRIAIWNKMDLVPSRELPAVSGRVVKISISGSQNMETLLDAFCETVGQCGAEEKLPEFALNLRAMESLRLARQAVPVSRNWFLSGDFELAAAELRRAIDAVGRITGKTVAPDVLEQIFSQFCIGK